MFSRIVLANEFLINRRTFLFHFQNFFAHEPARKILF